MTPDPGPLARRRSGLLDIRPGLCSVTLRHLAPEAIVDLAATAGLEGIEWAADVHVRAGDVATARRVGERCAANGVRCPSYGSYLRAGESAPSELRMVLETAVALGATNVRVWCRWLSVGDASSEDRRRIADDLGRFAAAALDRGLTVSVEFHPYTLTETAASAVDLVSAVGAPNLFTYWQPADDLEPAALLGELAAVREHLSHLHVFRWSQGGERLCLDRGDDLWPAALGAARRAGRWVGERWAFLEFVVGDDPDQLLADAATLRSWLGAAPVGLR